MGGSKQTQTTSAGPWKPAQQGLENVLSKTQALGDNTDLFKPVYSTDTNQAITNLGNFGKQASYGATQIQNAVGQTDRGMGTGIDALIESANGSMLGSNPYLDAVLGKSMQDAADRVNAQFSAAGRYGSGAQTTALTRELGGIENEARMNQYNQERTNQLNSAQLLGSLGLQGANLATQVDPLKAQQIGYQLQAGQLKDAQNDATRTAPLNALNWQSDIMSKIGSLGQESTSTSKTKGNTLGQILGGAQMAIGLATGNPMMALGGMGGGGGPSSLGSLAMPFFGGFSGK